MCSRELCSREFLVLPFGHEVPNMLPRIRLALLEQPSPRGKFCDRPVLVSFHQCEVSATESSSPPAEPSFALASKGLIVDGTRDTTSSLADALQAVETHSCPLVRRALLHLELKYLVRRVNTLACG
jgi:hypothetical protein